MPDDLTDELRASAATEAARVEWDTTQLQEDFEVLGFRAPYCVVRRKSDGQMGSLQFDHMPRRYYDFTPHRE